MFGTENLTPTQTLVVDGASSAWPNQTMSREPSGLRITWSINDGIPVISSHILVLLQSSSCVDAIKPDARSMYELACYWIVFWELMPCALEVLTVIKTSVVGHFFCWWLLGYEPGRAPFS